jgi:hypothetical protein
MPKMNVNFLSHAGSILANDEKLFEILIPSFLNSPADKTKYTGPERAVMIRKKTKIKGG